MKSRRADVKTSASAFLNANIDNLNKHLYKGDNFIIQTSDAEVKRKLLQLFTQKLYTNVQRCANIKTKNILLKAR